MSRQFDELYTVFPHDILDEEYVTYNNVDYARIKGYRDYYVSSDGDIISYRKEDSPKALVTWPNQYGHRYTRLCEGKFRETVSVHREVAKAFIPNPNNYPIVRHLNDDPNDNSVRNLAWGTQSDNICDMLNHGRAYTKPVIVEETGKIYSSCAEAADDLGVHRSAITMACKGYSKTVKGLHIRYLDGD